MTKKQKMILVVLGIMDILVIGGLIASAAFLLGGQEQPVAVTFTPQEVARTTGVPTWTPSPTWTPRPTIPPRPTNTPEPTRTPFPTLTPTPTPVPRPIELINPSFDLLMLNRIPGWDWDAYVNYKPGQELDPNDSYAEPFFTSADDPMREIAGTTLKIETMRWLKFRAWVHQTITVTAGSTVYFEIKANAFSSLDSIAIKAGIDPTGAGNCYGAEWGETKRINQESGTVTITSPRVRVPVYINMLELTPTPTPTPEEENDDLTPTATVYEGRQRSEPPEEELGRVTVCFYAEPTYAHVNNAAFFDEARIVRVE